MRKLLLLLLAALSFWFGYKKFVQGKRIEDNPLVKSLQTSQRKSGSIRLNGILLKTQNDDFKLSTDQGTVRLEADEIQLNDYVYQKIIVGGMFSGTTLYVDRVELQ